MSEKKEKILYLITKSNWGGAQKYVFELATEAKNKGYDVLVAAGDDDTANNAPGLLFERVQEQDIKTIKIKNFKRDMSFFTDTKAFFEVFFILIKERPSVIHISSSKAGGIGTLAARLAFVKNIIFTSHGLTTDETWRPKWQQLLVYCGTWLTIFLSHKTIVISKPNFETVSRMSYVKNKVVLIHNGIREIDFVDKAKSRKVLGPEIPQRSIWIGGIGELHENKNWSVAIRSMKFLPKNVHLVIIGEGDDRPNLERLIQKNDLVDRVHLLGFCGAPELIKAWDIFILVSKKEGLPYVLLEAGLAELPVVASDLPGNHDIIESGQSGHLVEPTEQLISTSLLMLIRDERMRQEFGQSLHKKVTEDFSIETMVNKTFSLYDSRISEDL